MPCDSGDRMCCRARARCCRECALSFFISLYRFFCVGVIIGYRGHERGFADSHVAVALPLCARRAALAHWILASPTHMSAPPLGFALFGCDKDLGRFSTVVRLK